jgi:hypothetical protein
VATVDGGRHQRKPRLLSTGASSCAHQKVVTRLRDHPPGHSHCIPKHKSPHRLSKKCWSLSKKMQSILQFLNATSQTEEQWVLGCCRAAHPSATKAIMKTCAVCHRKLGLGTRFRNIWNGRWWVHVRFCSVRCEGIYEIKRNDAAKRRWHAFLTRGNSRS